MASNEIIFSVKVQKDGNLKVVAKEAGAAAKQTDKFTEATEKTTKSRNRFKKGEKGVGQAGLSSAKSFSKMNQTMVGSGGLVGAYATLAANVFALTAAFGILQRASAANQLAEGLAYTGAVAGRNLPYIADRLKDITGEAVSTAEAMSAVAIATSSGFSSGQIAKLGEVAKGASLALGRDMTDALSRLIRGSAKLEPELLDELGIMVRLDEAAQTYATQLNTTVANLTQYQKRQAFANAVIKEGQEAFAGIGSTIDPNAYDQLGAALQDLLKDASQLINVGLEPIAKFLSGSRTGMVAGVALFASTIRGALLPSLSKGAQEMSTFAAGLQDTARSSLLGVKTTGKLPKIYKELVEKIKDGTATSEEMTAAQNSLSSSLTKHSSDLANNSSLLDVNTAKYATKIGVIEGVTAAQASLLSLQAAQATADLAEAGALTLQLAAHGSVIASYHSLKAVYIAHIAASQAVAISNGVAAGSFIALSAAIHTAKIALKAIGIILLRFLPHIAFIGIAIAVAMAAWDHFFGSDETVVDVEEINESLKHLDEVASQLAKTLALISARNLDDSQWKEFEATLTAVSGASQQVRDRALESVDALEKVKFAGLSKAMDEVAAASEGLTEDWFGFINSKKKLRFEAAEKNLANLEKTFGDMSAASAIATLELGKIKLESNGLGGQGVVANIDKQIQALNDLEESGESTAKAIRAILATESDAAKAIQALNTMTSGLSAFAKERAKFVSTVSTPFDKMSDSIDEVIKSFTQLDNSGQLTEGAAILKAAIDGTGEDNTLAKAMKAFKEEGESAEQTAVRLGETLKKGIATIQKGPGLLKKQTAELKKLTSSRKTNVTVLERAQKLENDILDTKKDVLLASRILVVALGASVEKSAELLRIDQELEAIAAARRTFQDKNLEKVQTEIAARKLFLDLDKKSLALDKEKNKIAKKNAIEAQAKNNFANRNMRSTELTAKQTRTINADMLEATKKALDDEKKIKDAIIKNEYDLLRAKAIQRNMDLGMSLKQAVNSPYVKLLEELRGKALTRNRLSTRDTKNSEGDTTKDDEAVRDSAVAAFSKGETIGERFYEGFFGANAAFDELNMAEKFGAAHTAIQPLLEDLRSLGPQGEVVAGLSEGMLLTGANILNLVDKVKESGNIIKGDFLSMKAGAMSFADFVSTPEFADVAVAALNTIGSAIGQLGSIMAAASANRVAGVDAEIAAEKKRDGTSAKSLAKIKGLEKKKEMMQRKAFEQNKKMMIAQAIMATAAGAIGVYAGVRDISTALIAGVMSAAIVAMGVAQVAIISGMSYQGGGSASAGASAPTSVSVGKRGTSSDMSKSQSGRGELAYFRGDQGMGGAENFRSAFYGKKHRAAGGNAGYVVGEQGPELFMPDRPGTIVPADDAAAGGGSTNVTFSINAIDAAGVEDVLAQQQGNIIGMIREAANSYGQDFMEELDESTYTTPIARRA